MDETEAIRRLKQGNIDGLEYFVARYQLKATRAAFLITQDQALAEDVTQDAFIRIFQNFRSFIVAVVPPKYGGTFRQKRVFHAKIWVNHGKS